MNLNPATVNAATLKPPRRAVLAALLIGGVVAISGLAGAQHVQGNPVIIEERTHATTGLALRDMAPVPWHNLTKVMPDHDSHRPHHLSNLPDAVVQTAILPKVATTAGRSFDGINDAQGGYFVPPDTNAAVGATQVVETVNVAYAVYNKATGAREFGPTNIQTLYTPLGGVCASASVSDPTVVYDKIAHRWVITMIAYRGSVNDACVAVSTTADASGTYHVYAFPYGALLPDYPKVSVWPDAYYLTTNNFKGNKYSGAETCALNRTAMLAGQKATAICFKRGVNDFSLLPADLDGSALPPAGAPNYQLELGTTPTTLDLYRFHADFTNPKNSTFTGPIKLTIAAYTDACPVNYCIPQPPGGEKLDGIGDRLMYRLAYRNYATHESLVATHSVQGTGTGHAASAVRWYEIRNPGATPVVHQSGTVGGGASSVAKWMASIAMDKVGDIALGYSKSSTTIDPSIEYVGRVPSDPLGSMESPALIIKGTGVQENSYNRWGDYSSMAIDPTDDCTFWYAQEYDKSSGSFNWSTRLASFKFNNCH